MKRILVIDDEEWLREMVHLALSQRGYEVIEAGNGVEALSLNAAATTAATGAGLTVSYTPATGVLSITGSATTAVYQTILQGIQ